MEKLLMGYGTEAVHASPGVHFNGPALSGGGQWIKRVAGRLG